VGVDYEFRFHRFVGTGVLVDYAGGEAETTVAGVGVFFHPHRRFMFLLAPGLENNHGHDEFLVRVGAAYEFHLRGVSISPTVNVDFVDDDEILVYGFSLGYGF